MTYNYDIDKDDTFSGYNKIDEVHGSIKDLQSEIGSVYDSHKANDNTVNSLKQNLVEEIINKENKRKNKWNAYMRNYNARKKREHEEQLNKIVICFNNIYKSYHKDELLNVFVL
ncbi:hypothetical protein M9Y10_037771 [Tritrichomonas musculus]|uniref:Uncharacterized protein n=1 Tax=Tritrichomonas musculus TaxID=1915356 RepID=A0ABR2GS54_9EUKA